jgi:hypothetical protein
LEIAVRLTAKERHVNCNNEATPHWIKVVAEMETAALLCTFTIFIRYSSCQDSLSFYVTAIVFKRLG